MKIDIQTFAPEIPKLDPSLLPSSNAQLALNCHVRRGTLEPIKDTTDVFNTKTFTKTVFPYRSSTQTYWFEFDTLVDIQNGATANEQKRVYWTGDDYPKMTYANIASSTSSYPSNHRRLGVPNPDNVITPGAVSGDEPENDFEKEARVYTYTFVSALGEESKPSPASTEVTVGNLQTIQLTVPDTAPSLIGSFDVTLKRIYRSLEGEYYLVAEIPASQTSYTDNVPSSALSVALETYDYDMPPEELTGLLMLSNGVMAGFVGNELCFSEPYQPHAWPEKYRLKIKDQVVAIGETSTGVFVATTGQPRIMSGIDPQAMSEIKLESNQSCVSKRSLVDVGGSVIYASEDGLVLGGNGSQLLTKELLTRDQWQAYNPSSMHACWFDDQYIVFYDNGTEKGALIFDLRESQVGLKRSSLYAMSAYSDLEADTLYLLLEDQRVVSYETGSVLSATWRSKLFIVPQTTNFGYGRVIADAYPVSVEVFADGVSIYSQAVSSSEMFRLPSGFRAKDWEIELKAPNAVRRVTLANSTQELM